MAFGPKDDNLLYAASGCEVLVFDLRTVRDVLHRTPLAVVKPYEDGSDNEINALKVHHKGEHMALGDDEGNVLVLEMHSPHNPSSWRVAKRLSRGIHTSIVGAVAFKPNSARDVASGGFDCVACGWDFALGRPLKSFNLAHATAAAAAASPDAALQLFNPPCVHALGFACCGRVLLATLGDGSFRALASASMAPLATLPEAHNAMATCLHILPGGRRDADGLASADLAVTAGVDGNVRGWAVNENGSGQGQSRELSITPLFTIAHGRKINAVASFAGPALGAELPATVLVADTTGDISLYNSA